MNLKYLNYGLLVAIALTLAATLLHGYLPDKRLRLIPGDQQLITYVYSNYPPGATNYGELRDWQTHTTYCLVRDNTIPLVCSFNLLLSENPRLGVDLTRYQRIKLGVEYQGAETRMRFYMRQFDPRLSSPDDYNSTKFHFVTLRMADFQPEVSIELNEFKVADWWVGQYDLPRQLAQRDLSNVINIGLDFEGQMKEGEHLLKVTHLEFEGDWISAEHWYQAIIALWMAVASFFVILRLAQLRRQSGLDQQRISELDSNNRRLQSEREKLRKLSTTDALTGVMNRHGFSQAIEAWGLDKLAGCTLILLDIDHFKRINDRRGHDTGDRVLRDAAQLLKQHVRERDLLARWGGEEFVLLCPDTSASRAFSLAEKLRNLISDSTFEPEKPLTITASLGIAVISEEESFDSAFKRADQALYQAKSQGRNCTILAGSV